MNVQRFVAPSTREAMAKARMVIGETAVMLSSRSTERGYEVVATAEENLDALAGQAPGLAASAGRGQARGQAQPQPQSNMAEGHAGQKLSNSSSVAQDAETLAMSTLSFQDYVRERMLRKRRQVLQGGDPSVQDEPQDRHEEMVSQPREEVFRPQRQEPDLSLNFARPVAPEPERAAAPKPVKPQRPTVVPQEAESGAIGNKLTAEMNELKAMLEERFNTLAWLGNSKHNPIQSNLMLKLIRAGYSPTVARAVLERMPAEQSPAEAFRWMQDVLAHNLRTPKDSSSLCDEGGVFALVGTTGVGKTTAAAKLAAQCVKAYGANSVGLITLDTSRVAGYEQLRTYGRMLGVVAHLAHDRAALQDLLGLLAGKRMVIIDTAGVGQHDPRTQEMLKLLATPKIKKMLVLNACSHGETLDDVLDVYRSADLYGVVLSKFDEVAKIGPAIDALIRHQVILRGVSTGQRVPEDWHRPDAQSLVRMSMGSRGKSAHDPSASELNFYFSQPVQGPVQLETWNA